MPPKRIWYGRLTGFTCQLCGAAFTRTASDRFRPSIPRHCSLACLRTAQQQARIPRVCRYCGVAFTAQPSELVHRGAHYCSKHCHNRSKAIDPVQRFLARVDRLTTPDGCWLWTGVKDQHGYGRLSISNSSQGIRVNVGAHRFALEQQLGRPLAPGMRALHRCDNPPCCRNDGAQSHLFEGTDADNVADRTAKGRGADVRGERNGAAKLTNQQVQYIKRRWTELGPGYGHKTQIAHETSVPVRLVYGVTGGRRWQSVSSTE